MFTARHDPDRMSITEAIALAQSAALGIPLVLEGPAWPATPGATVVIVYGFLMSITLFATVRASARTAVALALAGAAAGVAIVMPYVVRTGLSLTGLAGLVTVVSALATAGRTRTVSPQGDACSHVLVTDSYPTTLETSVHA